MLNRKEWIENLFVKFVLELIKVFLIMFQKKLRLLLFWEKFKAMYERKHRLNKASLLMKITRLCYKEGLNMLEHFNEFQGLINHCTTLRLKLDDDVQALLLFSSLPDSWKTLFVTILILL